jgi:hypothetical protein
MATYGHVRCSKCDAGFVKTANMEIHEQYVHGIWHNRARNARQFMAHEMVHEKAAHVAKWGHL